MRRKIRGRFSIATFTFLALPLMSQQGRQTYDPGIRPATAASLVAEKASEDAWFAHLQVLASDDLKGRLTGTADFLRAADYVEEQFKTIGLKPAGTEGYRQPVGFRKNTTDVPKSSLEIVRPDGSVESLKLSSETILSPHVDGSGPVEAPAVFAGYGFAVPSQNFDDVTGVDLRGKIAVVFAGSPPSVHGPLRAYFRTAAERWKALKAAGAIGVVTIQPASNRAVRPGAGIAARPIYLLSDPQTDTVAGLRLSATLSGDTAKTLFAGTAHSFDELQSLAASGKSFPEFPLGVKIRSNKAVHILDEFKAPNVVGFLPGTDRHLKSEYLVISAHLDHVGVGREVDGDSIYNGAMDNAAGVSSLIEVAKSLAKQPPKRSVLFLALTGEEEGELGSQYFARFPTVPRGNIVADLNMDMYLPIFPLHFLEVQGLGESTLGNDVGAAAQLNDIEVQFDKQPDENRFIRSDQASFVKYGIPGLAFKFGWLPGSPEEKTFNDWIKNRYHRPGDDLNQPIDREAAVHFDRVLFILVERVANAPTRPSWYPESFFSTIPRT
jgi:Zn-dependent M28 family amino/carboxypeptidase